MCCLSENRLTVACALLCVVLLGIGPTVSQARDGLGTPNYPARYMGGEANIITAPNGAHIYDKALAALGRIVYTEPTVENLGDGV